MAQMKDSVAIAAPHTLPAADSMAGHQDTAAIDTTVRDTSYVLVIDANDSEALPVRQRPADGVSADGMSWILGGLLLLFTIVAIRFRNNSKYLSTLFKSAVEVRERGNVFDDTVKETSFMVVLNVMWSLCAGVLLFTLVGGRVDQPGAARGMGFGVLLAIAYELFMLLAYWIIGNVFSDRLHTRMWIRGFLSATGLTTLILFPAALATVCYPADARIALWIGLGAFILGKIVFISKGFRIFFTQISAWVLFLYYLCSLEIVPLILLYVSALQICR